MSNPPLLEMPPSTSATIIAPPTTTTTTSSTTTSRPSVRQMMTAPKATSGFRRLLEQAMAPTSALPSRRPDDHGITTTTTTETMTVPPPNQEPLHYPNNNHHSYYWKQDQPLPPPPPPMIDYWRFKKRLKFFARRRCHILHILQRRSSVHYYNDSSTNTTTEDPTVNAMNQYEDQAISAFLQPSSVRPMWSTSGVPMSGGVGKNESTTGTDTAGNVIRTGSANGASSSLDVTSSNQEDIYTHAPLSYNLSMDPHAHIGRGSDPIHPPPTMNMTTTTSTTTGSSGCDYVEMNDDIPPPTTTFGVDPGDDASHTSVSTSHPPEYHDNDAAAALDPRQTLFCLYPFPTPPLPGEESTSAAAISRRHNRPPKPQRRTTIMRQLSISERNEIVTFLEWEMDQCYMYYLSQYSVLLQRYNAFLQLVSNNIDNDPQATGDDRTNNSIDPEFILSNMMELGDDMIELMAYCTMNIVIAQQILIRYDALALTLEGTPMLNYYLKRVLQPPLSSSNHSATAATTSTSSYYKVRYHDEIYHLANQFITNIIIASTSPPPPLTGTVQEDTGSPVLDSNHHEFYYHFSDNNHTNTTSASYTTRAYMTHFQEQIDLFRTLLDSLQQQVVPTTITPTASSSTMNHLSHTTTASTLSSFSSTRPHYHHPGGSTTTSYWYNTLKYTLSSYYETMMRYSIKTYIQMGLFEDRLGLEPGFLSNRGQSLTREMESIVQWRERKHSWFTTFYNMNNATAIDQSQSLYYFNYYNPMYHPNGSSIGRTSSRYPTPLSPSAAATTTTEKKLSGLQIFHLTLNMLAAFLYCMNYYIVEPSSTMYVNRLGAHDAMSGTLIGMMPLAAFVSSIPYSMWTNRSFRHPFIMSSIMLIAGNLMYSFADQFGVVWIALLGRFMAGLGAPKCIIRRYMADTTPVSLRTSVNAGFGMVVAAGSAMGPAMAIVLNRFEYTCYVKHLGLVTLNGLTLPGYFMACLWLTFFVIVVLTFEEPDREGLKEQKELEAMGAIPLSPSNMGSFGVPDDNFESNPTTETSRTVNDGSNHVRKDDELYSVFSGESNGDTEPPMNSNHHGSNVDSRQPTWIESHLPQWMIRIVHYSDLITLPVRICLGLLFCKVFTIEALVSSTSALTKNRYQWQVTKVGKLGFANGVMVIPFSILVGRLSMTYQDHVLMKWLVSLGCCGMFLLIDLSDLVGTPRYRYNAGHVLAVAPRRYIVGYFISYLSIQAFEGVIGSTLSKVIPTALASGTFNSGLLATLVDTFGRTCGDLFISAAGFLSLRQLMNLLFIPGFLIMLSCLIVIERCRDLLSV